MKSLEKDRTRRYETANDFAADVVRHLGNRPVAACPPSAAYRLRKFVRRNRLQVAAASALIITMIAGIAGSTLGLLRALDAESTVRRQNGVVTSERDHAIRAESEAQAQRQTAEAEARRAVLRLADNYTSRGLEDGNSTWNARAALWFANAAVLSRDDPQRVQANLIRVHNWLQGQWTLVAAVGPMDDGVNQLSFDPKDSRYLITFKQRGIIDAPPRIWDLATEQPLRPARAFDPLSGAVWASDGQVLLASPAGQVALASMPELKILRQWDAGGPRQSRCRRHGWAVRGGRQRQKAIGMGSIRQGRRGDRRASCGNCLCRFFSDGNAGRYCPRQRGQGKPLLHRVQRFGSASASTSSWAGDALVPRNGGGRNRLLHETTQSLRTRVECW